MKKWMWLVLPLVMVLLFNVGRWAAQQGAHPRSQRKSSPPPENSTTNTAHTSSPLAFGSTLNLNIETLQKRFQKPYPKATSPHHSEHELEVMQRLWILQKLRKTTAVSREHLQLYRWILENNQESWAVQRQALINMAPHWSQWSARERDQILSRVDLRARQTWRLSDRELISLFGESL